jgi:hypothetical protein
MSITSQIQELISGRGHSEERRNKIESLARVISSSFSSSPSKLPRKLSKSEAPRKRKTEETKETKEKRKKHKLDERDFSRGMNKQDKEEVMKRYLAERTRLKMCWRLQKDQRRKFKNDAEKEVKIADESKSLLLPYSFCFVFNQALVKKNWYYNDLAAELVCSDQKIDDETSNIIFALGENKVTKEIVETIERKFGNLDQLVHLINEAMKIKLPEFDSNRKKLQMEKYLGKSF